MWIKLLFINENCIENLLLNFQIKILIFTNFLLLEANKRMEDNGDKETISFNSVMSNLGISEDELLDVEDIDIE